MWTCVECSYENCHALGSSQLTQYYSHAQFIDQPYHSNTYCGNLEADYSQAPTFNDHKKVHTFEEQRSDTRNKHESEIMAGSCHDESFCCGL